MPVAIEERMERLEFSIIPPVCSAFDLAVSDTGGDDEIRFRRKIQMRHVSAGMHRSSLRLGRHICGSSSKSNGRYGSLGLQIVPVESSCTGGAR